MKRIVSISLVVLVVAAIVVMLIQNKKTLDSKKVMQDRSGIAVSVALYPVALQAVDNEIRVPATLAAHESAAIAAASAGRIVTLSFDRGTRVNQGQVIGKLDVRQNELKLASTNLSIEKLKRDHERNKVLAEGNAINTKTLQDSQYDLDTKVLEAEQLKKQIADGNLVAPVSGIVTDKKKETGEYVNTGEVIGTVVNIQTLKAKVYVPESKVFMLQVGQAASVTTDVFPGQTFNGRVTFISPQGDDNHNYLVEVSIANNQATQLKAGMYALITFNGQADGQALLIPKAALADGIKNPYVFVAENGKAVERRLTLGREFGDQVEVRDGLRAGEHVIISGQINLVQGSLIKAIASK